jgi:hypothetical protein
MVWLTRHLDLMRTRRTGGFASRSAARLLVLAILLAGLLSALPVQRASANSPVSGTVTVKLTILEVENISANDGLCGANDFYPKVYMKANDDFPGDGEEQTKPPILGDNHPFPNWVFERPVEYGETEGLGITIALYEDDTDSACFNDDLIDITPAGGQATHLLLDLDLGPTPCMVNGHVTGSCGTVITAEGNGGSEGGSARIKFRVDVPNPLLDSDGDGIPDDWELYGVYIDPDGKYGPLARQLIDLPKMGAEWDKPDIFLQVDWMADADPNGKNEILATSVITTVMTAFAQAPASATRPAGINLHVDQGPNSVNFPTNLARAKRIDWAMTLGTASGDATTYDWSEFENIKTRPGDGFISTGRSSIFHYVIVAAGMPPSTKAVGISRGYGASDFIVADGSTVSNLEHSLTLMHELGHNLGLRHGGGDDVVNKPNYLSIMNPMFSSKPGLLFNFQPTLDYSRAALLELDEEHLNENIGLDSAAAGFTTYQQCPATGTNPTSPTTSVRIMDASQGPIDWDCETKFGELPPPPDPEPVRYDVNGDGQTEPPLQSFDDWGHITFKGGLIGGLKAITLPMTTENEPPPVPKGPSVDAGGPYEVVEGSSVMVTATASDPEGGSLTYAWDLDANGSFETPGQSVTFSAASLSAPSSYTIKVQVTDETGLTAVDTAIVNVIYHFSGFFQPVDNLPVFNTLKAGSAVAVKFSLSGDQGLEIFEAGYPKSQVIPCDSTAPVDGVEETVAAGASSLSYDPRTDQYSYVWKTDKAWAGTCRHLVVKLNDGTSHRANFQLTK